MNNVIDLKAYREAHISMRDYEKAMEESCQRVAKAVIEELEEKKLQEYLDTSDRR